jgi:hypothetical protein
VIEQNNPDLVIVRAGMKSLHRFLVPESGEHRWDLVVCPFQPLDGLSHGGATIIDVYPGQKWNGLRTFLNDWDGWRNYEYIWIPDDDIVALPDQVATFLFACHRLDAKLAAPALSEQSYYSHLITLTNRRFRWRQSTFVEIMMPCFRSDILSSLLHTLDLTPSGFGFGLDFLWPKLLAYSGVFIVDAAPVLHTRPVGAAKNPEALAVALGEWDRHIGAFGLKTLYKTIAGETVRGVTMDHRNPNFLPEYLAGYDYLIRANESAQETILSMQSEMIEGDAA